MNIPCTLSLFSSFFIPFSASVSYLPSPLFSLLVLFLCLSLPPTLSPFSLLSLSVLNSRWRWHCKRSQGQRSLNLLVLFYFYLTICLFLFDSSILLNIYPYSSDGPSQSSSPPPTTTTPKTSLLSPPPTTYLFLLFMVLLFLSFFVISSFLLLSLFLFLFFFFNFFLLFFCHSSPNPSPASLHFFSLPPWKSTIFTHFLLQLFLIFSSPPPPLLLLPIFVVSLSFSSDFQTKCENRKKYLQVRFKTPISSYFYQSASF